MRPVILILAILFFAVNGRGIDKEPLPPTALEPSALIGRWIIKQQWHPSSCHQQPPPRVFCARAEIKPYLGSSVTLASEAHLGSQNGPRIEGLLGNSTWWEQQQQPEQQQMQERRKSAAGHATSGRRLFQIISEQNAPSPLPYQDHLFDALMMETLNGSFSVDSSPEPGSFSEGARREDSNGDMGSPLEELAVLDWREVARARHTSFSEEQVADSEEARTGEAEGWLEAEKEGSSTSSVSGPSDGIYDRFKGAGEEVAAEGTLPQGSSSSSNSNSRSSSGNADPPTAPGTPLSTPLYKAEESSINTSSSSRGKPNFAIPPSEAVPSSPAPSSPDGDLRSPGKPYFAPLSTPDPLHLQGPPYQPWKGIDSPVFAAAGPADNSPPFPSPSGSSSGLVQQGQLVMLQKKHGVRESMFVMTPVDQVQDQSAYASLWVVAAGKGAKSLSNQQQLQMQQSVTANAAPPAAEDNDYDWILLASGPFTLPALSCSSNSISDEEVEGVGCEHAHSGGCDVQQGHEEGEGNGRLQKAIRKMNAKVKEAQAKVKAAVSKLKNRIKRLLKMDKKTGSSDTDVQDSSVAADCDGHLRFSGLWLIARTPQDAPSFEADGKFHQVLENLGLDAAATCRADVIHDGCRE